MKIDGFAAKKQGAELTPFSYTSAQLKEWEIGIEISHCGMCHSDVHLIDNDWGISKYPLVPGHEIVGIVKEVGSRVSHLKKGDRVGIGWQCSSCLDCHWCSVGEEQVCSSIKATCLDQYGGYAHYIRTDARFAFVIPKGLSSEIAAPLLCGGATVFTPLMRFQMGPGHKVGIIGIGGLGHLALQFARALGCEVTAISSSPKKKKECLEMGAHHFCLWDDLAKEEQQFDLLLSSSIDGFDWESSLSLLNPFGKLCFLGALTHEFKVQISSFVAGSKMICGSNIGSRPSIRKMLEFAALFQIQPLVEIFPLDQVNVALQKLRDNQIRYRGVLKIS